MKRSLRRGCNVVLTVVMGMLLSALNEAQPPERLQRPRRRVHGPDLRPSMKRSLRRGCNGVGESLSVTVPAPSMKRSLRRGCNAILRQTSAAALAPQ